MFPIIIFFTSCINIVSSKECNILDYGAIGDGKTDDTSAIQSAINTCTSTPSELNTILFPSSYNFLSYPIVITNNATKLLINSILTASPNNYSWPQNKYGKYQDYITAKPNLNNIIISGNGLINGNGEYWWHPNNISFLRPYLIVINYVININISYLTLLNSPMFHIYIGGSNNVVIHNLNISSPNYTIAPNTDGIDIGSKNVHIYDCHVRNGDDSYSIWPGAENVLIENSYAGYGLGLDSWDGGMNNTGGNGGKMNNVTFRNMYLDHTPWGIRLRTYSTFNGSTNNFKFINITMNMVDKAIDINQFNQSIEYYNKYNKNLSDLSWTSFNNISFSNIYGTFTTWAGHLDCSQDVPCYGLDFNNIDLKSSNQNAAGFSCSDNVYGTAVNVTPSLTCLKA